MENVTQAVQDELVKSLDYKLGSSNVNYIQSRRDIQYYPSSLSTFTPTTSRVARIPLTSGMDFIDPESLKIAFRVRNNDATLDLNPGTQEPSCFIKRVQLFANGQRCDDISEYGRCCFLYSLLKPAEWYKNKGITGFWELAGLVPAPIPATNYKDVLMAPTLIGMFQAGKFLPPQLNLVLELEFAEPADALRPGGGSTDYSIENVRVLASQVTLDSALYESYQKILLSGRSLVFAYPTMHTQVSSIPAGSTSHNVTVARAFTKLLGAFVSFRDIDDANLGECSNFEHPGDGSQFSTRFLESQMQLGALQYPRTPMVSDAEHFHFLEILAGTYDSSIKNMRIADNLWNNSQFIAAFPVERVPKHPLSGISTRSGDLARFTFKGLVADRVQRMYIHLLSYQIVTVSGGPEEAPREPRETPQAGLGQGGGLAGGGGGGLRARRQGRLPRRRGASLRPRRLRRAPALGHLRAGGGRAPAQAAGSRPRGAADAPDPGDLRRAGQVHPVQSGRVHRGRPAGPRHRRRAAPQAAELPGGSARGRRLPLLRLVE